MALINSVGVGNGSKSVGEFTYRSVRGRTIASKRVMKNSSNSAAQGNQRSLFAALSKFLTAYDCYVFNAFTKSRYGSRRNRAASELKSLASYMRTIYENLTANGVPLNLTFYWFPRVMAAIYRSDDNVAKQALLQSSNSGVSVADIAAQLYTPDALEGGRQGLLFSFAIDKCGTELLELIRSKRPAWSALSDSEVLHRAFVVSSYAITQRGRGVFIGESQSLDAPSAGDITPIGSYTTPDFNLLSNVVLNSDELSAFGLEDWASVGEKVYVFNILKFLGEPVNMTFDVAMSTVPDIDTGILPIEQ